LRTVAVSSELVRLYWSAEREILARQAEQVRSAKVIDRLCLPVPGVPRHAWFFSRNPKYLRTFAETRVDEAIVQKAAAQTPRDITVFYCTV